MNQQPLLLYAAPEWIESTSPSRGKQRTDYEFSALSKQWLRRQKHLDEKEGTFRKLVLLFAEETSAFSSTRNKNAYLPSAVSILIAKVTRAVN
jgi:hypothetical protein